MKESTARRWLAWIALALGLGAALVGTPARREPAVRPTPTTLIRGC